MSGPNFAIEIAHDLPTGTTLASSDTESLKLAKKILSNDNFIVEISSDVVGVEMGGVLKNVYAIAMGALSALDINENAYYFILTEAFKEMKNIIRKLGGREESLFLSSGFGDLCLTSSSNKSRNRILGFICGKRMLSNVDDRTVIFEGKKAVRAVHDLIRELNLDCPVVDFVYEMIWERNDPYGSFLRLWNRLAGRYR